MKFTPRSIPLSFVACVALFVISAGSAARAQEIVVDGGFEAAPPPNPMDIQGPFGPAWTVVDPSGPQPPGSVGSNSNVGHDTLFAHSGNNHANLGAVGLLGSLSQNLNTMPGQAYTLTFWLANDGAPPNEFDVFWNGASVLNLVNQPVSLYTQFTLNVTATTASTPLEFRYRNDDDFFRLDDVSVTAVVPEPSIAWLALTGLPLLALARRRALSSR